MERCATDVTFARGAQVRIMFEVQDLRFATLATVSRCGMVWFSEDVLTTEMIFENYMQKLRNVPVEEADEDFRPRGERSSHQQSR